MEFVKELHESRLIRSNNDLKYSFREILDNLYLIFLTLDFLSHLKQGKKIAVEYGKLTASYINYTEFRTNASDLYNLIYFTQADPDKVEKMFGNSESKELRLKVILPRMEINRWLMQIDDDSRKNNSLFFRLEQALSITNSDLKDIRRMLSYKNPSTSDLTIVSHRILNMFRNKMPLFDLKQELEQILSSGKYTYIK